MKKILITGKNSYIGKQFESWVLNNKYEYQIDFVSLRDQNWRKDDWSKYDIVIHLAAIVHLKESKDSEKIYDKINKVLTIDVAEKAKNEKVNHFIFMSSMSVYGSKNEKISIETLPIPETNYGRSKLNAEKSLEKLKTKEFLVSIIRPPMIYGENCEGNFNSLLGFSNICSFFLKINNKRSMIYIHNLSEYLKMVIDYEIGGIHCPQNLKYVSTYKMISQIRLYYNKKTFLFPINKKVISFLLKPKILQKIFGDLYYDNSNDKISREEYNIYNFEDSIKITLKRGRK